MDRPYISNIKIKHVRHLKDIEIPITEKDGKPRHLILTGKNGSGKTSLLDSISTYLNSITISTHLYDNRKNLALNKNLLVHAKTDAERFDIEKRIKYYQKQIAQTENGIELTVSPSEDEFYIAFHEGNLIIDYCKTYRKFTPDVPKQIESIELKDTYSITEEPRKDFVKYLVAMKATEAFARNKNNTEKADAIKHWFERFEEILKEIFDDKTLKLDFDEEKFTFRILEEGRDPFDFNTLASGYAAVLDIVADIIMRMEKKTDKTFSFDIPGVVLIDEIETHLHLKLQQNIMKLLEAIFPNVQFIVSTHSPFVLNSISNAVIFDLENNVLVDEPNGLNNVPYSGIVEGYFNADELSSDLRKMFERYKTLARKKDLTNDDLNEIAELERYLDEIPDFLALDISTEYSFIKADLHSGKD